MVDFEHKEFNKFIRREKGRFTKDTWMNRQSGIAKFEEYILKNDLEIDECTQRNLDSYLSYLTTPQDEGGAGLTDLSASLYMTAVRKFYDWYLMDEDAENPARKVSTSHMDLKNVEYDKITLNQDELRALVDSAETQRGKALISLMASTGLRLREACSLKRKQVELEFRKVSEVKTLKRDDDHHRDVFFDRRTRRILKKYINGTRAKYGESKYFFTSRNNTNSHMSTDRGRVEFKRAVENCDEVQEYIDFNVMADGRERSTLSSHILRRSFCQIFVDNGGDIMTLKNIAGWDKLETAKSYLDESNDLQTRDKFGVQL